jgi:hypothetical protein
MKGGTVRAKSTEPLQTATLNYTADNGPWQKREWTSIQAKVSGKSIEAKLPATTGVTYFMSGTVKDGIRVSSEHSQVK